MKNHDLHHSIIKDYEHLDKKFNTHKDYSYEYFVNFSKTKDLPIYNWFYFVEGYSPELVSKVFNHLGISKDSTFVLDPFSGSGTSLLVAKSKNMKSLGFEINPFSAFMIDVKTRNYTQEDIKEIELFFPQKVTGKDDVYKRYELRIIQNLFNRKHLEEIESIKEQINLIKSKNVRDILYMCMLAILPIISNYRKGGNGLKRKKTIKPIDTFAEFLKKKNTIVNDLKQSKQSKYIPQIINDSCLNAGKYNLPSIDISIFSPPYANCFDPFEVYKTELWIGEFVKSYEELRIMRKKALTSNLNANLKKDLDHTHRTPLLSKIITYLQTQELWDKRIPIMLDTYFSDMNQLLNLLFTKTKRDGYCVIVVGNSAYANMAIPIDILLAELAELVGFNTVEIIEARRNETSSQQHTKLGKYLKYMRESIIILKKND